MRPPIAAPFARRSRQTGRRAGLTLLEVVVSLAIFLFSLAAITQLLSFSRDRVIDGHLRSEANVRCQSKLAEVMAGVEPLSSSGSAPFSDNPSWTWQVTANENEVANLWNVEVSVQHKKGNGSVVEVSLSQMMLAPSARGSTLIYMANVTNGPNPSTQQAPSTSMAGGGGGGGGAGGAAGKGAAAKGAGGGMAKGGGGMTKGGGGRGGAGGGGAGGRGGAGAGGGGRGGGAGGGNAGGRGGGGAGGGGNTGGGRGGGGGAGGGGGGMGGGAGGGGKGG